MTNSDWIRSWENGFSVSLRNTKNYKRRYKELCTWDKPLQREKRLEWACKKIALKGLILETHPNSEFKNNGTVVLKK